MSFTETMMAYDRHVQQLNEAELDRQVRNKALSTELETPAKIQQALIESLYRVAGGALRMKAEAQINDIVSKASSELHSALTQAKEEIAAEPVELRSGSPKWSQIPLTIREKAKKLVAEIVESNGYGASTRNLSVYDKEQMAALGLDLAPESWNDREKWMLSNAVTAILTAYNRDMRTPELSIVDGTANWNFNASDLDTGTLRDDLQGMGRTLTDKAVHHTA